MLDPRVRAVYVCTTNPSHMQYSLMALRLGKPVLCEKPAASDLAQTREIVRCAREEGVYYMEGMWMRHNPVMKRALEWVRQGRIGRVRSLSASFAISFPYDPAHRLFDPTQGGGALFDVGVYVLALSKFIFDAPPTDIAALSVPAPTGVDITTACTLKYPDSAVARLFFSVSMSEPNEACITGDAGHIYLPHRFWSPRSAYLRVGGREERFAPEIPGEGLYYEFDVARADIEAGRTENALMTHDLTLGTAELTEKIRDLTYRTRPDAARPE